MVTSRSYQCFLLANSWVARKHELRELVENSQMQVESLTRKLQEVGRRAAEAVSSLESTKQELERASPFEAEVKEKNLLIGKLRHQAVILNDHLTKALRHLKKGKPEDTIDKYVHEFWRIVRHLTLLGNSSLIIYSISLHLKEQIRKSSKCFKLLLAYWHGRMVSESRAQSMSLHILIIFRAKGASRACKARGFESQSKSPGFTLASNT